MNQAFWNCVVPCLVYRKLECLGENTLSSRFDVVHAPHVVW